MMITKSDYTISGKYKGGVNVRSDWLSDTQMTLVLAAMLPENALAIEVSDATGLRLSDVLSIKTSTIVGTNRPYVTDAKTGKRHRIYIPRALWLQMLAQAGKVYVWPGRLKPFEQHRTRDTVYKDMRRAVEVFRRNGLIENERNVSPHSARKRAAVRAYRRGGFDAAADLLQHSRGSAVTALYALSDKEDLRNARRNKKNRRKSSPHSHGDRARSDRRR